MNGSGRISPARTRRTIADWKAVLRDFSGAAGLTADPPQVRRMVGVVTAYVWTDPAAARGDVTTAGIERYLAALAERGRSPKTLLNHRGALSRWCRFLVGRGLLASNPCESVRLRRPEELLPRWLNDAEVKLVLRIARARGFWPEICLALSTGLRLSEMIRLQWADVDFSRRCLAVRKSKSRRPRIVPLSRSAMLALRIQRRRAGRFAYVFPSRRTCRAWCRLVDKPRAINWWGRALQPIKDAVPKFNSLSGKSTGRGWHLFRHTFASRAVQAGVSLYKVAQWLGHSDVRMTQIYAHLQAGFDVEIEGAGIEWKGDQR